MGAALANAIVQSTPYLTGFNPHAVPYQFEVIKFIRTWDYANSEEIPEVLLSGSYGSAKSILVAHLIVTHCMENPKAVACIARRTLPDLRATLFQEILEHIEEDLVEGVDYWVKETNCSIRFRNGSRIIAASWADRKYKKFRSLKISALAIEELTENDEQDMDAFKTLTARLRRIHQMTGKENFVICATNPDSPSHWAYQYFILGSRQFKNRRVFYSRTLENPFLDRGYYLQLARDLPAKEKRRYLDGEWVEITTEVIYSEYDRGRNYRDEDYELNLKYPIHISWDFNIGLGKPLSVALFQFIDDKMHIFGEVVVEGMRTADSLDELADRGLLDYNVKYIVNGDATGKNSDTRNKKSDYDIIRNFLSNYVTKDGRHLDFEIDVPLSNPPIRKRHNLVNSYCLNGLGQVRLFVYRGAPKADEGLRLTQLKKGAEYVEDDSKDYQHITTAIGYGLFAATKAKGRKPQRTTII